MILKERVNEAMDLLTNAARVNKKSLPEGELVEKALDKVLSMFVEFMTERDRSSLPEVFFKRSILKNFAKFTGNHLKACKFIKKI